MATIRMTQRELELTKAKEQGERDFERGGDMPQHYEKDLGLKQAWSHGYIIARADYRSFYGNGY